MFKGSYQSYRSQGTNASVNVVRKALKRTQVWWARVCACARFACFPAPPFDLNIEEIRRGSEPKISPTFQELLPSHSLFILHHCPQNTQSGWVTFILQPSINLLPTSGGWVVCCVFSRCDSMLLTADGDADVWRKVCSAVYTYFLLSLCV